MNVMFGASLMLDYVSQGQPDLSTDWRGAAPLWRWHRTAVARSPRRPKQSNAQLVLDPELAAGEAYMDGSPLDRGRARVYDFLALMMRNMSGITFPASGQEPRRAAPPRCGRLSAVQSVRRARRNVAHHYDIDPRIYDLFLDRDRQYSCAYFAARRRPRQRPSSPRSAISRPSSRSSRASVCSTSARAGAGLPFYLATDSRRRSHRHHAERRAAQAARRARAAKAGLDGRVRFELQDYRDVEGRFDRIVSVGMFEHVGVTHYADVFPRRRAASCTDDGVGSHAHHRPLRPPAATNPLHCQATSSRAATSRRCREILAGDRALGVSSSTDIEVLRLHYARDAQSLARSASSSTATRRSAIAGEGFCRMWEFYLAGSEAAFRYQDLVVFQIQLAKAVSTRCPSRATTCWRPSGACAAARADPPAPPGYGRASGRAEFTVMGAKWQSCAPPVSNGENGALDASAASTGTERIGSSVPAMSTDRSPPRRQARRPQPRRRARPFRQPPHNIEAEQALLGAILVNNEALDRVSGFLEPEHFFDPLHGQIYETLGEADPGRQAGDAGHAQDVLRERRADRRQHDRAAVSRPPRRQRHDHHQRRTTTAARSTISPSRRSLIVHRRGHGQHGLRQRRSIIRPKEQIEEAESAPLRARRAGQVRPGLHELRHGADARHRDGQQRLPARGHLSGLATGLTDLDNKLGGLQPSDLIILAGRPSMGKTALATNIAYNIAKAYAAEQQPDGTDKDRSTAASSASSRSKCRPSSSPRVFSPSRPRSRRRRSAAA